MGMGSTFVEGIGVERFEVALVGVAQGLGRCRRHRKSDDRDRGRCKQGLTYRHLFTFSTMVCCSIQGILTAMADPCCQSLAAAQARFPESQGGWRGDGALTSFTATRLGSSREHVTFNGSAGWRNSRPMSSYSTGTNSRARRPVLETAA